VQKTPWQGELKLWVFFLTSDKMRPGVVSAIELSGYDGMRDGMLYTCIYVWIAKASWLEWPYKSWYKCVFLVRIIIYILCFSSSSSSFFGGNLPKKSSVLRYQKYLFYISNGAQHCLYWKTFIFVKCCECADLF